MDLSDKLKKEKKNDIADCEAQLGEIGRERQVFWLPY
jgi:hypothetical protein